MCICKFHVVIIFVRSKSLWTLCYGKYFLILLALCEGNAKRGHADLWYFLSCESQHANEPTADSTLVTWWRHQMETLSALLAICAGNSPAPSEFPAQRPVTRGFDVFFDLHPNKRLRKQRWGWWFEMPPCPSRRHRNVWYGPARSCPCALQVIDIEAYGI